MKRKVDPEVAQVVSMVRMCQNLQALPAAGGLLDQDAFFVLMLQTVMAADAEKDKLEQARHNIKMPSRRQ